MLFQESWIDQETLTLDDSSLVKIGDILAAFQIFGTVVDSIDKFKMQHSGFDM